MHDGHGRDTWQRTSQILAVHINAHRDPKSKAVAPEDLNPYAEKRRQRSDVIALEKGDMKHLQSLFTTFQKGK